MWYARNPVGYGMHPAVAYQVTDESDLSDGVQNRREAQRRSHWLNVEASYPVYVLGHWF